MSERKIFSWPVRVYYQDTDAGGVVYHSNYVNFMERARTEWLRDLGYSHMDMIKNLDVMFVVRSIKLDYLRPAVLDDLLQVSARIKEIGRSRVTLEQTVTRGEELLAEGEVHLVCVEVQTFKPVSVPEILRKKWN
ncbi:MAG: tol-pal system-associated acyl-CoA thioesterase [Sideroxyarcus sp.]